MSYLGEKNNMMNCFDKIESKFSVMVFLIVASFFMGGVSASDFGCLQDRWKETSPTEQEKQFDLLNDYDRDGQRFSCNSYTTPTKIYNFVSKVKVAIINEDIEFLSGLMRYPLVVNVPGYVDVKDGGRKGGSYVVLNREEFQAKYLSKIYTKQLLDVFSCARFENIMTHPYQGLALAYGDIWIYVSPDDKSLSISHLSVNTRIMDKWLVRKCGTK